MAFTLSIVGNQLQWTPVLGQAIYGIELDFSTVDQVDAPVNSWTIPDGTPAGSFRVLSTNAANEQEYSNSVEYSPEAA